MPLDATGSVVFPVSSGSITELRQDDFFHNRAVVRLNESVLLLRQTYGDQRVSVDIADQAHRSSGRAGEGGSGLRGPS